MINSLLTWLVEVILNWLASAAKKEIEKKIEQVKKDEARGEINEENVKKYNDALERSERIKASEDLLNRIRN